MARQYYTPGYGVTNSADGGREWYAPEYGVSNEPQSGPFDQTIAPTGIASTEAFGTAVVAGPITTTGIASTEAFGTASLTADAQTITITAGITSTEAFGTLTIAHIVPTGVASTEAFGTHEIFIGDIGPRNWVPDEAFGTATLSLGTEPISPTGITSAEAFGSHVIVLGVVGAGLILASSLPSAEAFGTPTVSRGVAMATGWDTLGSLDAGQPFGLLPPQDLEPFPNMQHLDFDSLTFRRWFEKLNIRVRQANQIHSTQLQLQTVNIADFGSKNHNDLDGLQGGSTTERVHWTEREKLDNLVRHWVAIDT